MSESAATDAQLSLVLPAGKRDRGQPRRHWQRWTPEEQLAIDCRYDGLDGWSAGRYVGEAA